MDRPKLDPLTLRWVADLIERMANDTEPNTTFWRPGLNAQVRFARALVRYLRKRAREAVGEQ